MAAKYAISVPRLRAAMRAALQPGAPSAISREVRHLWIQHFRARRRALAFAHQWDSSAVFEGLLDAGFDVGGDGSGISKKIIGDQILHQDRRVPAVGHVGFLPPTRADCPDGAPCPHVSCRHHLWIDVIKPSGDIKTPWGMYRVRKPQDWPQNAALEERLYTMDTSCSIDVAEAGPKNLQEIGEMYGLSRERMRQICARGLIHALLVDRDVGEWLREYYARTVDAPAMTRRPKQMPRRKKTAE